MSEISCNLNVASFAYLSFSIETQRQCNGWFADMTGPFNVLSNHDRIKVTFIKRLMINRETLLHLSLVNKPLDQ